MIDILRQHIEKIVSLSDEEFAFACAHFTGKKAKKHEWLIQEGQNVNYAYFVVSGLLKLVYRDDVGREFILSFAMEDWWETDYLAYFTKTKATLALQCLEDTEVYCLTLEDYYKLCNSLHKMEHFFLIKANGGYLGSQQRILSFLTLNVKERYEHLIKRYPTLFQRVPKKLIASYLGVSRETLSRLAL